MVAAVIVALGQVAAAAAQQKTPDTKPGQTLKVGDKAPDFEADTFDDKTIKLSDRFGDDGHAVVLLFSRASW